MCMDVTIQLATEKAASPRTVNNCKGQTCQPIDKAKYCIYMYQQSMTVTYMEGEVALISSEVRGAVMKLQLKVQIYIYAMKTSSTYPLEIYKISRRQMIHVPLKTYAFPHEPQSIEDQSEWPCMVARERFNDWSEELT